MPQDEGESFGGTDRFRVLRRLGAGAFGVVYEVQDREHDAIVALKVLRGGKPETIARFKREFRALADLTHPNLVSLHELALDGARWFFTMERVDGVTLLDHARDRTIREREMTRRPTEVLPIAATVEARSMTESSRARSEGFALLPRLDDDIFAASESRAPAADPEKLRRAVVQLCAGLAALHAAGKVHRDVKPSNALVAGDGRVVLLDFGLVTDANEAEVARIGTPAYMAPEQASEKVVTYAADLYAVGVILFEALTGVLPFTGSVWSMLRAKVDHAAPDVGAFAPDAPADLRMLCGELLERDPARRPSALDVVRRLRAESSATLPPLHHPPFVGRERELAALADAVSELSRGKGSVSFIHGPSGVGKSALARRALDDARAGGAMVLAARCYEQEELPYKTLDGVMDALVDRWLRDDSSEHAALLPDDLEATVRLFPALMRLPLVADRVRGVASGENHEVRRRAFAALRDMFSRLAAKAPLVIFVDDLQWGDVDGALLLAEMLRAPAPALLFVGAYRDDERESSATLRALHEALSRQGVIGDVDVGLAALSAGETATLAARIAPGAPLSRDALDTIVRESLGLPFLVEELVRLASATSEDHAQRAEGASAAATVERIVRARLETVPSEARAVLDVLAIAGQPIARPLVRAVAGVADEPTAFSVLRAAGLIRTMAGGALVEPYHDRVRETVLLGISAHEGVRLHGALARALEARGDAEPERLAHHYEAAGKLGVAALWVERAGDRAIEALAFDRAAHLYARARKLLPHEAAHEKLVSLREREGDALADAGRSVEAANAYEDVARTKSDSLDLARKAAEHLLRAGLADRGVRASVDLLARLGIWMPRAGLAAIAHLAAERAWLALRGLDFHPRPAEACDPLELLRFDTCSGVSLALARADPLLSADAHTRALRIALSLGEPSRVRRALFLEASFMLASGESGKRVARLRERIAALDDPARAPVDAIAVEMLDAFGAYFHGDWRLANTGLLACERYLLEQCRGVSWELGTVRVYALAAMYFLGDLPAFLPRVDTTVTDAVSRGDVLLEETMRLTYTYFAALVRDEPARAREEIARGLAVSGGNGSNIALYWSAYGEAEAALYESDGARAWEIADGLWRRFRRSFMARIEYLRVLTEYLRARAAIAHAAGSPKRREAMLAVAARIAVRMELSAFRFARAASPLVRAAVATARGDAAEARRTLEEAVRACEAHEMSLYGAAARRALARHAPEHEMSAALASTDQWMRGVGVRSPERLASMLAPGL